MSQRTLIAGMGRLGLDAAGQLLAHGHAVWGVNRSGQCAVNGPTMLAFDLTRPLTSPLPEVDNVVIALAPSSRDPQVYQDTYLKGVSHLLEALPSAGGRLLYVSSTVVYPQQDGSWIKEASSVSPHNLRAKVQLAAESVVEQAADSFGAGAVVLRLGGIYGPDRLGLLERVRSGQPPPGSPTAFTNRISQHDASRLLVHLLDRRCKPGCYLGVDQEPAPMQEVCAWLAREMGITPPDAVDAPASGKRISSKKVLETGFRFDFPSYRDGYRELLPLVARRGD